MTKKVMAILILIAFVLSILFTLDSAGVFGYRFISRGILEVIIPAVIMVICLIHFYISRSKKDNV